MTAFTTMTKSDLLAAAKVANILGRWDMTKAQLAAALDVTETQDDVVETVEQPQDELVVISVSTVTHAAPDAILDAKRRYPSEAARDATGKVIRVGKRLSGNQPFAHKFYFLSAMPDATTLAAAPPQAQLIVKAMSRFGITCGDSAMIGEEIVDTAKRGGMATKSGSAELFAYYRRLLEKLGVVHHAEG